MTNNKQNVPFQAARLNDAIVATSDSFWRIAARRVSRPSFVMAAKKFIAEFERARKEARGKTR